MKRLFFLILCAIFTLSLCSCTPADAPLNAGTPDTNDPIVSQDTPMPNVTFEEVEADLPENLVMIEYEGYVSEIWDEDGLTCFKLFNYRLDGDTYRSVEYTFGIYPNEHFKTTAVNPEIKVEDHVKIYSFTYDGNKSQKYHSADIITVIPKQGTTFYALVLNVNGNNIFAEGLEINGSNNRGLFDFTIADDTKITYNYTEIEASDISAGDIIAVTSSGTVLETYPSTYLGITQVSLLTPANKVPDYDPLVNASVTAKTFTGRVNWIYTHNGRIHLGMYDDTEWYCEVILPEGYETSAAVGETVTVTVDAVATINGLTKYSSPEVTK